MASIKKRPNGAWRARYRDGSGREHTRHFARKVDGQRWLDQVTSAVITGSYVDPRAGTVTLRAYFDQWSARQVWVRETTAAMNLAVGSAPFADIPIKAVARSHIEAWVKAMTARGLAPGTVITRYNHVRSVFRAARRDKVIGEDPTEGVTLPRRRRAEVAMTIPSPEDVGTIIAAAQPWFKPLIGLCAFAGLRLGEAAAVKVDDIDFLRRTLTVHRQVQRADGHEVEIRAPKYGCERVVFLPDGLLAMLPSMCGRLVCGPAAGCSPAPVTGRLTRTSSAGVGVRPCAAPGCQGSSCTTCATFSPAVDRRGLRCGDGAAGAGPLVGDDDAGHLQPPVADRRGPDPQGSCGDHGRGDRAARDPYPTRWREEVKHDPHRL